MDEIVEQQNLIAFGYRGPKPYMLYYNSNTKVWTQFPKNIDESFFWESAAVLNQRDIVAYGRDDSVKMFEWTSQTWNKLPRLPIEVIRLLVLECLNGKVYVAAKTFKNDIPRFLCYSFDTAEWRFLKNRDERRKIAFLIEGNKDLYVYRCCHYKGDILETYNPELDEWTVSSNLNDDLGEYFGYSNDYHNRFSTAAPHEGKIYFCGKGGFAVYDPETQEWSSLPKTPIWWGTSMISMNGQLLILGGQPENPQQGGLTVSGYKFDFSTQKWKDLSESGENIEKFIAEFTTYCLVVGNFLY